MRHEQNIDSFARGDASTGGLFDSKRALDAISCTYIMTDTIDPEAIIYPPQSSFFPFVLTRPYAEVRMPSPTPVPDAVPRYGHSEENTDQYLEPSVVADRYMYHHFSDA